MTEIKNVNTLSGESIDFAFASELPSVDGSHLTLLPALIDPHVHFRAPGNSHKEDWTTAAQAAVRGGITTVFEMPNNNPACTNLDRIQAKKQLIDSQLTQANIPLRYGLYLGAEKGHLEGLDEAHNEAIAFKVFMGSSTGDLLIDTFEELEQVFQKAATYKKIVAVHAEDEKTLLECQRAYRGPLSAKVHSLIRPPKAAEIAISQAIELSAKYGVQLYILHVSTREELALIDQAKKSGVDVWAEATPNHLFFSDQDYDKMQTLIQVNPPIRTPEDREALWEALNSGLIDTLGTDHAPHTLAEKQQPYGQAPSGMPGVETLLPLMLNAVSEKKITLSTFLKLSRTNIQKLFALTDNDDHVLVDLNLRQEVTRANLSSKCGWSPYEGQKLVGWPVYTILKGHLYTASGFTQKNVEESKSNEA